MTLKDYYAFSKVHGAKTIRKMAFEEHKERENDQKLTSDQKPLNKR